MFRAITATAVSFTLSLPALAQEAEPAGDDLRGWVSDGAAIGNFMGLAMLFVLIIVLALAFLAMRRFYRSRNRDLNEGDIQARGRR